MNRTKLIIMARPPEYGKVKSRLAADIGHDRALVVYQMLLRHTLRKASESAMDVHVFWSENSSTIPSGDFTSHIQTGDDLGERMANAIQSFKAKKVLVIGSDCLALNSLHLRDAEAQLDQHDIVFGPAKDGGYYLIGMKQLHPALFQNISWSTEHVLDQSIRAARRAHLSIATIEPLSDIDDLRDLEREQ
jgi:rSAM/selenodomain-associated transferase 1